MSHLEKEYTKEFKRSRLALKKKVTVARAITCSQSLAINMMASQTQAENVAKLDKKLKKNKTDAKVAKTREEMAKDLEVPIIISVPTLILMLTGEDEAI